MATIPTPPTPTGQEIVNGFNNYVDFDQNTKNPDASALQESIKNWMSLIGKKSPEEVLMLFWVMVMAGGNGAQNGSFVRGQEDLLTEVAKKMNYASGYRDVAAEIKNQLVQATQSSPGNTQTVSQDLDLMDYYNDPNNFPNGVPPVFLNSGSTFSQAEGDIKDVLNEIGPGKTYASFYDLAQQAQQVGQGTTSQASTDFQKFVNACDTLSSAVGIQSNILSTQMQDTEANYNSYLSSDSQAVKSLFSITDFALQHMISS